MYEIEDKDLQSRYVPSRRKDTVKNLIIIFLTIMLLLTFFSNTIMNYSLPQVATQYVQQGEISPKIRGTGVAQVETPVNVNVPSNRVISSGQVTVGEKVEEGAVLFELEDAESDELIQARQELADAKSAFEKALFSGTLTNEALDRIREGNFLSDDEMQEWISAANSNYNEALSEDTEAQRVVDRISNRAQPVGGEGEGEAEAAAKEAQENAEDLADAMQHKADTAAALAAATTARDNTVNSIQAELELKGLQKQIDEAQKKVESLEGKEVGTTVKAPVAGTITSVGYNVGDTASADMPGAVIRQDGKKMTVSFSVSKEQAQALKVGMEARPQNEWAYTSFKATLESVTQDQADPAGSRVLTFVITSDEVEPGDSVQLSVGTDVRSYDLTIPNSAVREDNAGKFVLVVVSKESPLGNRYIASRVDVTVLDSDDTLTAVTGNLSGYEYVITTSTKPVSAGMQVRLAENGEGVQTEKR